MTIQFTDDEIDTIKSIINEWGSDCPGTDYEKVKELEYKLGLSVRPTPEEIAEQERKRKEFADSPYGKQMAKIMNTTNQYLSEIINNIGKPLDITYGFKNLKTGENLRINLPTDYQIKKD